MLSRRKQASLGNTVQFAPGSVLRVVLQDLRSKTCFHTLSTRGHQAREPKTAPDQLVHQKVSLGGCAHVSFPDRSELPFPLTSSTPDEEGLAILEPFGI